MKTEPKFIVSKTKPHKVTLLCSECGAVIREIGKLENLKVDRGYYCEKHDDGAVHLNLKKR